MKATTSAYGGDNLQAMVNKMKPYSIQASPDPVARMMKFRKLLYVYINSLGLTAEQRDRLKTKVEDFATASYDAGVSE
tara:strand:- start:904 stop:1137 length:234 start_codon:yes stop_codon:yes gene_type:complete